MPPSEMHCQQGLYTVVYTCICSCRRHHEVGGQSRAAYVCDCSHGTLPSLCPLTSQGGRETERAARPQAGQGLRGMAVAERTFADSNCQPGLKAWVSVERQQCSNSEVQCQ